MTFTPKQIATLARFLKVTACELGVVAVTAGIAFVTNNDLGLSPTVMTVITAIGIPAAVALQKWLTWQEAQP